MRIGVFGGSIRPGGGLTVLKLVTLALAREHEVVVYTGAEDSSAMLRPLFEENPNITERKFFHGSSVFARYLISKAYFLVEARRRKLDWILSLNYYIPAPCRLAVYHINLLNFQPRSSDDFKKRIRNFDAKVACRRANLNIFESQYLSDTAARVVGGAIHNPALLYVAVDPDFYRGMRDVNGARQGPVCPNIVCVSSLSPYKDNESVVRTLQILVKRRPEVNWTVSFAGGQSVEQWASLKEYAEDLGVGERVSFLGPIPKAELSCLMSRSLCMLNCSMIESFCMVAVEAMASRCPVIVTSATAMPESVCGAGIIATPGKCEDFAKTVITFYDNPEVRQHYVKLGTERAANFREEKFGMKLRGLLTQ